MKNKFLHFAISIVMLTFLKPFDAFAQKDNEHILILSLSNFDIYKNNISSKDEPVFITGAFIGYERSISNGLTIGLQAHIPTNKILDASNDNFSRGSASAINPINNRKYDVSQTASTMVFRFVATKYLLELDEPVNLFLGSGLALINHNVKENIVKLNNGNQINNAEIIGPRNIFAYSIHGGIILLNVVRIGYRYSFFLNNSTNTLNIPSENFSSKLPLLNPSPNSINLSINYLF